MAIPTGRPVWACPSLLPVKAYTSLIIVAFPFSLALLSPCGSGPSAVHENQRFVSFCRGFLRFLDLGLRAR